MDQVKGASNSHCPGCGKAFRCAAVGGDARCWCFDLPPGRLLPDGGSACYCADCLRRLKGLATPATPPP